MEQQIVECNAEFTAELVLAVPYAYWLHKRGLLKQTISVTDTKPLYFFSDDHIEKYNSRTIDTGAAGLNNLPNNWMHHNPESSNGRAGILDFSQWEFPPFKEYYKNDKFVWEKPLCIISSKYTIEWGEPPINFLDISTLYELFSYLTEKYTVVYKRSKNTDHPIDQNENHRLGDIQANVEGEGIINDFELARRMGVIVFRDLLKDNSDMSYNELQFKLFANCDKFITTQGGNSHIAGVFGKQNINFIKRGKELREHYHDKGGWYNRMNGCEVIQASEYDDLIKIVKEIY